MEKVYNVYFDDENGYVVMNWTGYATTSEFKEGTETMLRVLAENKTQKVLANTRDMDIIGQEDQRWVECVFLPRAIDQGFKAIALVKPVSYFNRIAIENISYKAYREKIQINIFDSVEEAESWLKKLDI